jgi:hypothetical protein
MVNTRLPLLVKQAGGENSLSQCISFNTLGSLIKSPSFAIEDETLKVSTLRTRLIVLLEQTLYAKRAFHYLYVFLILAIDDPSIYSSFYFYRELSL